MPPPLALLLCTAFVLFLLRVEWRGSRGVSVALWIPTLWFLSIGSKPLGIWFGTVGDAESGSVLDRLLLTGLLVAALAVLACRQFDWFSALRRHGWLLAILGYMFLSTLWSDITFIALRRWIREVIVVVMALVIMSEANPRQALESVLRRSAYILIPFSLLLIKYYPALGVDYGRWSGEQMWIGVTGHKNSLGRLCLVGAFFLLWVLYRRWRERAAAAGRYQGLIDALVALIALYLLKGAENSYSATSIGTFAAGVGMLLGLVWLQKRKRALPQAGLLVLVVCLVGVGVSAPFLGGSNLAAVSSALGRDETLTGRTETWAELVPVVERSPLLGHGFGSFWTTARRDFYRMSHGHNGYLDTLLELGVVGLGFYTAWLLSCAGKFHAAFAQDHAWANLAICFLAMALIYNVTESSLNNLADQMTAVIALASLVLHQNLIRAPHRSHLDLRLHVPPQRVA